MPNYLKELLPENALGWKLLEWLQDKKGLISADVHQLLTLRKAIFLLPADVDTKIKISRSLVEDHVLVSTQFEPEKVLKTLSFNSIIIKGTKLISINSELQDNDLLRLLFEKPELFDQYGAEVEHNFMEMDWEGHTIQIVIINRQLQSIDSINLYQPNEPLSSEKVLEKLLQVEDEKLKHQVMVNVLKVVDQIQANHRPILDKVAQKAQELYIQILDNYTELELIETVESFLTNQIYPKIFAYGPDAKQDEQLDSKIIVLNKFQIQLKTLDPYLEEDNERYHQLIEASERAGEALKKINDSTTPKEKLNAIILAHEVLSGPLICDNEIQYVNLDTDTNLPGTGLNLNITPTPHNNQARQLEIELSDMSKLDPLTIQLPPSPEESSPDYDDENASKQLDENKGTESKNSLDNADKPSLNDSIADSDNPPPLPKRNLEAKNSTMISADELLPLLIYSIITSNPPHLYSNLKFIQRFRHVDGLTDRASYCLTNMLAAISYIETFDIQSINPPSAKVSPQLSTPTSSALSISNITNIPKDVTGEGVRAFSGMVDIVMGRFWSPTPKPSMGATPTATTPTTLGEDAETKFKKLQLLQKPPEVSNSKLIEGPFQELTIGQLQELFDQYKHCVKYLNDVETILNS